ncbi:MAG: hypothetical protein WBC78_02535 [Candidatus Sulfotelmatobacter sp.]
MAESNLPTEETAKWLVAAVLTLSSALTKTSHDETFRECQNFYDRLFGVGTK